MDDFDAKNHIRDMHREADQRRLAQLAQAGKAVKQIKPARLSLLASSSLLLILNLGR